MVDAGCCGFHMPPSWTAACAMLRDKGDKGLLLINSSTHKLLAK
jgi:hypothetical protein